MPVRKQNTRESKDQSKNDSMNVSNIISSLVEANKNRIVTGSTRFSNKRDSNFDKLEEFKLFPNKKNSSIYEPSSSAKGSGTHRSNAHDDKSLESRHNDRSASR